MTGLWSPTILNVMDDLLNFAKAEEIDELVEAIRKFESGEWSPDQFKKFRLTRGTYYWYVWPGFRRGSTVRYGPLLGRSSFAVRR